VFIKRAKHCMDKRMCRLDRSKREVQIRSSFRLPEAATFSIDIIRIGEYRCSEANVSEL